MTEPFSWETFCQESAASQQDWSMLGDNAQQLLRSLRLSQVHPTCDDFFRHQEGVGTLDSEGLAYPVSTDVPQMGPMSRIEHYHSGPVDLFVTMWQPVLPAIVALTELLFRLFAVVVAPLGIAYLLAEALSLSSGLTMTTRSPTMKGFTTDSKAVKQKIGSLSHGNTSSAFTSFVIVMTVLSSVVLSTDTCHVYESGPTYGISMLLLSSLLSWFVCRRRSLRMTSYLVYGLLVLTVYLSYDSRSHTFSFGGSLPHNVQEGLYHDDSNSLVNSIVQHWPIEKRTYDYNTGATPWMPTGDARTMLPFLMSFLPELENLQKVWLPTVDGEHIRLEVSFPATPIDKNTNKDDANDNINDNSTKNGVMLEHDPSKPVFLLLHGLTGGSQEEYVRDFTLRANANGSTVVIMIARGLMDTPVKGWNIFDAAKVVDVHATSKALRRALSSEQTLVGAGYSMGAIILANYVARAGKDCPLDAAIPVSGGLDMRPQQYNYRSRRLVQRFVALSIREQFVLGKFGDRYGGRLTREEMRGLFRADDITVSIFGQRKRGVNCAVAVAVAVAVAGNYCYSWYWFLMVVLTLLALLSITPIVYPFVSFSEWRNTSLWRTTATKIWSTICPK